MTVDELRIYILAVSLILSNGITIFLYLKNRRHSVDSDIKEKLFKLQDIVIDKPFLEDKKFISGWNNFRSTYNIQQELDYSSELNLKYLQYEQYCEMLFNFASETYHVYDSEKKLLEQVDFKSWCRVHKNWWINPLEEHSNHDTYDENFCTIIDSWLK